MTTHTISVYNPKGGTGRTTLAVHLADYLATRGARLLLRDADPQGSALGWAYLAEQVREAEQGARGLSARSAAGIGRQDQAAISGRESLQRSRSGSRACATRSDPKQLTASCRSMSSSSSRSSPR